MVRKVKEHRLLEKVGSDPNGGGFARALASTEFHTRERGLQALTAWLSRRKDILEHDLLRLWKALFYCFWHSDKAPVQAALAERLSDILTQVPEQVGELYFKAFVKTMRREWFGIDRLRLDKFMMLVRTFFTQHLRQLQAANWEVAKIEEYAAFWRDELLLPQDTLVAAGVAYHITDMLLPQLAIVVQEGLAPPPAAALAALLAPFCAALGVSGDAVLVRRMRQGLFEPVLAELRAPSKGEPLRHLNAAALSEQLFELGARKETRAGSREALYAISRALEKAAAQRRKHPSAVAAAAPQEQPKTQVAAGQHGEQQPRQPAKAAVKAKKRKAAEAPLAGTPAANGRAEPAVHEAAAAPAAPAALAPSPGVQPPVKKKAKKNKTLPPPPPQPQPQPQQYAHAPLQNGAAKAAPPAGEVTPQASPAVPAKKNVRFSLRRNLVMTIGEPPAPAYVRTPPTSKPKGSALKKGSNLGPGSAPGRLQKRLLEGLQGAAEGQRMGTRSVTKGDRRGGQAGGPRRLPSPRSVPRPRASEFF